MSDEIWPWLPRGIDGRCFIAAGANHYIARYDDITVLKFPLMSAECDKYPAEVQKFRSAVRAAALKGLQVEEQILKILGDHPRINQLRGVHEDGLLLEYQPHGSVERYLQSHPGTSVEQRLRWGREAAEGLAYIHTKNVLQGDVSVGNLLLDSELSIKLCDFQGKLLDSDGSVSLDGGSAERIMSSMPRPDPTYMDRKTDIFAFGTALFFIITGELPFPNLKDEDEIHRRFKSHEFPPLEQLPGGHIIRNCWMGTYADATAMVVGLQDLESSFRPPLEIKDQQMAWPCQHLGQIPPVTQLVPKE